MRRRPSLLLLLLTLLLTMPMLPAAAAGGSGGYQQVVDLTFPVVGTTSYVDSFDAARSGGRVHMAADIMAAEGQPIFAAVGGTVETITGLTEKVPSYGYMIRIAGDDGRTYVYLHMGRNDGPASKAYVRGLAKGTRVARGEQLGFVGCSGNASCSGPHLHFEIHDDSVTDPYGQRRINPYPSLKAAQARGDVGGDRPVVYTPFSDLSGSEHRKAALELLEAGIMTGCSKDSFCPNEQVDRTEMAQVMYRALQPADTDEDYFSDDDGLPAEPAINALAAAGVVLGCGDGSAYCPEEDVSRARMASYLTRGFNLPPTDREFFVDVAGHGHEENINRLAASGITIGCTPDKFCVAGKVTRGQLASFVSRGMAGLDA